MMKSKMLIIAFFVNGLVLAQEGSLYIDRFTNVNPVSYTDVVFTGARDTVLVSTYSGRVAKIVNGIPGEEVIAHVGDEVYALAYIKHRHEIIASTLLNGLVVINAFDGKVLRKLPLGNSWANELLCSEDERYMIAYDQSGQLYMWDIQNDYADMAVEGYASRGRIVSIDSKGSVVSVSRAKAVTWSLYDTSATEELAVQLFTYADMDGQGNFLSIDFNTCTMYDGREHRPLFDLMHPHWPMQHPEHEDQIFEIPVQMQLNAAKFAGNFIYTAGLDRSVRVWSKIDGSLRNTLLGHKGSIGKLKVSSDHTQVVSVDLKGVIKFWEVEGN